MFGRLHAHDCRAADLLLGEGLAWGAIGLVGTEGDYAVKQVSCMSVVCSLRDMEVTGALSSRQGRLSQGRSPQQRPSRGNLASADMLGGDCHGLSSFGRSECMRSLS